MSILKKVFNNFIVGKHLEGNDQIEDYDIRQIGISSSLSKASPDRCLISLEQVTGSYVICPAYVLNGKLNDWQVAVTGSTLVGEHPDQAACREVAEEIGIRLIPDDLSFCGSEKGYREEVYHYTCNIDFVPKRAKLEDGGICVGDDDRSRRIIIWLTTSNPVNPDIISRNRVTADDIAGVHCVIVPIRMVRNTLDLMRKGILYKKGWIFRWDNRIPDILAMYEG